MKIKPFDRTIKSIFETGFYKIPRFQRPYSWDKANIEDFWKDISETPDDYFIGSMVAYRIDQQSDLYYIVDGQQRLTTITLLLCAIRNTLDRLKEEKLANAVHSFIEKEDLNGEKSFILQTETSYPYFQEHIQKYGKPDLPAEPGVEETALSSAFSQLLNCVDSIEFEVDLDDEIPEKEKRQAVVEKITKIRDISLRLQVIFVELDSEDDAYVIFETLNTRGKDLEVSDLVKNHIMKSVPKKNKGVDYARDKWNGIRTMFDESASDIDMNRFILHYWLSKHDYVSEKQVFKEIKRVIGKNATADFLEDLVKESENYRIIHEPEYKKKWMRDEFQLSESLRALNIFRVRQQMPMVMAILRKYFAKDMNRKTCERVLRAIECFHFIFTSVTSQRSSGGISFMYASAARNLDQAAGGDGIQDVVSELIQKLVDRVPKPEEIEINFPEILFSDEHTKQRQLVRYILKEMDRFDRKAERVNYDQMSIEHLASQRPVGEKGYISSEFVGQLGNLILVPQDLNNQLANKPFKAKKEILIEKGVRLDANVLAADGWGQEEIETRTKWMAQRAYQEVWGF